MDYAVLTLDLPDRLVDAASALLHERGALGVEVRDAEGVPPGGRPPPPGRAEVIGYFGGPVEAGAAAHELSARFGPEGLTARVGACRDEDWAESWKAHFPPVHVANRLWVIPPWEPRPAGAPSVVIEPGMAFGTGAHATTALCLEELVAVLDRRAGARVLDVGCGSGILGIAARALGAGRVVGVDNDPDAVRIARENAALNGCSDLELSDAPVERVEGTFEVVVANILLTTLLELARPIAARRGVGGVVLLSGILVSQAEEVRGAYEALGLVERGRRVSGEWAMLRMEGR